MFKKFKPMSPVVANKVVFLMDRGSRVVYENENKIVMIRHDKKVSVDSFGRVEWEDEK